MLFNVEFDEGNVIEGYLVPDGFTEEPSILVSDGAQVLLELKCRGQRDAVRLSGRHDTGLVGFRIDGSNVPGMAGRMELTIREARSGLLIYRRGARQWTRKRIVRLELQLVPLLALDRSVEHRFQYALSRAERFGLETTLQVFHLNNASSIYLAGRLQIRAFERFMESGFEVAAMLTEPYFEMAERILLLKRLSSLPESTFGPRDRMILAPAAERLAAMDPTSPKDIRATLKAIDPATARIIKAPLTRQLTTLMPDEEPTRRSVAVALDIISRFAATGLRAHPETFTHPFAELLGIDPDTVDSPKQHRAVAELAHLLRDIPQAETLLETDLMIYHFAHEAIIAHMRTEPQRVVA